ncbi:MAG: phosphate/phosphite/phosphonate ABC transporter substrate-binding protein [Desulfobulbaceae bacterium]|nr:phosphate/phosphite/phosphonate ABC transporter substrate-binding protein [Desulfobulbaceae bacterium]
MTMRKRSCRLFLGLLFFISAYAPWQGLVFGQTDEILLGIEPEHNIFDQVERYRYLAAYLSDQLGIKVNLTIMSRYGEVIKRFKSKRLDGAFLSSYTAAMGIKELNLEPVASPVNFGGESASQGYIFVRKDSGINSVNDMNGRRIVFVDPATMEGYLFPLAYLHVHGVTDINSFFNNRFYFSGSHASAVFAVLDGRADIGSVKDTVFEKLVRNDPSISRELSVIAKSQKAPEFTLCVSNQFHKDLKERLGAVLLQMDKTKEGKKALRQFEALRFIQSDKSNFDQVEKMAQEARSSIHEHGNN